MGLKRKRGIWPKRKTNLGTAFFSLQCEKKRSKPVGVDEGLDFLAPVADARCQEHLQLSSRNNFRRERFHKIVDSLLSFNLKEASITIDISRKMEKKPHLFDSKANLLACKMLKIDIRNFLLLLAMQQRDLEQLVGHKGKMPMQFTSSSEIFFATAETPGSGGKIVS